METDINVHSRYTLISSLRVLKLIKMFLNHLIHLHVICSNEQLLQLKISTTLKRLALDNIMYFYNEQKKC